MSNFGFLDRGSGKSSVLKNPQKTGDRRHHGDQPEVLGHEQPRQDYGREQVQGEFYPLGASRDNSGGNRSLAEIR